MKLKRGFTLVELLAVIAILALLVVFALPSVLEMYNRAKKELFLTEAKTVYKEVSKKYISENMRGNKLTNISSKGNKLDLEVNGLTYNVRLNSKGKVKFFYVSNGTYCLSGKYDNLNKLTIDEVKDKDCDNDNYVPPVIYCNFSGDMVQGAEFKKGPYTYRYKQHGGYSNDYNLVWEDISIDGWGVQLTDKESTDSVTGELCTYINDKPIVSMTYMFFGSQATSLDLSEFNTSNVTNMWDMFHYSSASSLDLTSFDTSNVVDMGWMFMYSLATSIDLSSFDTSSVTLMGCMFVGSNASSLDLTSFDTSNVTDMHNMFYDSSATIIDVSSFDTRSVTSMYYMFDSTLATSLDLRKFKTSNVTDMSGMFRHSLATEIKGLESFDTRNVTNMYDMFANSSATVLDLSNFDTRNVTAMSGMFSRSSATEIKGLESFDTRNVTYMWGMFEYSSATVLDLSSFEINDSTGIGSMFENAKATTGYAKNAEIAALLNDVSKTKISSTLKFVVK